MPDNSKNIISSEKELKRQKQPWWRWLITAAAIGLFVYVISQQGWEEFVTTLKTVSPPYALAGLALLFVSRQAVAARWYALLKVSEKQIHYWETLKLTYAGFFATNFLPTSIGGDLVRFIGMTQRGADGALVVASLIMDRIIGMAGMSLVLPGGIYMVTHPISAAIATVPFSQMVAAGGFGIPLQRLWGKILGFLKTILNNLLFWVKRPKNLLLAFLFTLLHELLLFGMLWFFLRSLGEEVSFWTVASLYSLSYLATLIPLSIGGLGIQEMSITYLFSQFGGVSMQAALALAVLNRMAFLFNSLPGVFVLPSVLKEKDKTQRTKTEKN